jgi:hypothetical protein
VRQKAKSHTPPDVQYIRLNTLLTANVLESQRVKTAYFVPGMSLDLRELELCVVWVHALDLLPCWATKHSTIYKNKSFNNTQCTKNVFV